MPQTKATIISYSLLAVTSGLVIYFILKTQKLNEELLQVHEKVRAIENTNFFRQPPAPEAIDSLLLTGSYAEALSAYQQQETLQVDNAQFSRALQMRMNLAQQMIDKDRQILKQRNMDTTTVVTDTGPEITPEEVRQFDSLNFALDKAYMRIEYLSGQLESNTNYAYLTFKTSKGIQAHYVGQVKDQRAEGQGVALLSTGSRYEGDWKNNMRHGEGVFYWPDGQYYQGNYKDDKRHGLGTYHWTNGEKFIGYWENDQRNGEGTFYGEQGEIVAKGTWKDDELVKVDEK